MAYIGRTTDGFGVRQRFVFTPNAGTTSISGNDVSGATLTFSDSVYMDVFLNGVLLKAGTDYNTNTANTIAGLTATVANDEVTVLVYDIFTTADMVSATSGGTFTGNVTHSGTVTVDDTTDSTSTTTGSIQTDGGLGVAKDVVIGDDLFLKSDSAVLNFGADNDINITHVADTGLTTNGDFSVGDDLKLTSDGAVLGFGADNEITVTHVADTGLRFEDSDKLLFGAGADLEIFHDGSNSFVSDTGTGDLRITGSVIRLLADNVVISNAANNEDMITAAADGAVNLRHNNVSCLTTTSDGGIDIEGGDIFFSTAGKGINLGVTSNTDSNTLDDYEEGTFTFGTNANVAFVSNSNVGKYTKIGKMVHLQLHVDVSSVSGTNHFYLSGMPFAQDSNTTNTLNGYSQSAVRFYNFDTYYAGSQVTANMENQSTNMYFYESYDSVNTLIASNTRATNSTEIFVSHTYFTDP
jgi:hypothetical protein